MAGQWEKYEPQALRIPNRGPFGTRLATEAGKLRDEEAELLRVALLSRIPSRCPDDAIDPLRATFQIDFYDGQTTAQRRAALEAAWPTHEKKGSAEGVEQQIQAFGIRDVRCVYAEVASLPSYSQFLVVLGPDFGDTGIEEQTWGGFSWGGSTTWGSTATIAQRNTLCRIVRRWKGTHGVPVKIVLRFDDSMVWGVDTWGEAAWGGLGTCVWKTANVWGGGTWGDAHTWGTGRWFEPEQGFSNG